MTGKMQQYPRTEYIQPPPGPPTLDAKNSPLALLAQTCSAIGKEPTNSSKANFHSKLYASNETKKSSSSSFHKPSRTSPVTTYPNQSTSPASSEARRTPTNATLKREKSPTVQCSSPAKKMKLRGSPDACKTRDSKSQLEQVKSSQLSTESRKSSLGHESKRRHTVLHDDFDVRSIKTDPGRHKSPSSSSPHNTRSFPGSCVCPPTSSSADIPRQISKSASPQQQIMSLYDPYCMGCQGPHVAGNPCFDGLKSTQLPFYGFNNPGSTYPLYAQMLLAAARSGSATVDPSPHVCNWVSAGTGSCGKRFSSPDELFNHLRTHTLATTNPSNASYLMSGLEKMAANPYAAYLSHQAAALASTSPSGPNPLNTNFLSRSHSPLFRYNPYKNSNMLSQLSGLPSLPIAAGVGPYCSPYALYGQRLGAASSAFSYP